MQRHYSIKQVQEILADVDPSTIWRLVDDGKLEKVQVTKRRVGITEESLKKHLESLKGSTDGEQGGE